MSELSCHSLIIGKIQYNHNIQFTMKSFCFIYTVTISCLLCWTQFLLAVIGYKFCVVQWSDIRWKKIMCRWSSRINRWLLQICVWVNLHVYVVKIYPLFFMVSYGWNEGIFFFFIILKVHSVTKTLSKHTNIQVCLATGLWCYLFIHLSFSFISYIFIVSFCLSGYFKPLDRVQVKFL